MVNFPNALQPPPSGTTLPARFTHLTAAPVGNTTTSRTNGDTNGTTSSLTNGDTNGTTADGTNSTLSITTNDLLSSNSSQNALLIDPHANASSTTNISSTNTNVGQHVLNSDGEVDGSSIGLGKQTGVTGGDQPANQSLSTAATAGVVIGGIVVFAILMAMVGLARRIHNKARQRKSERVLIADNASSINNYLRD